MSYTAGRDLYQGERIAYRAGDPVPADAFPPVAVESLLANGGLVRGFVAAVPPRPKTDEGSKPSTPKRRKEA